MKSKIFAIAAAAALTLTVAAPAITAAPAVDGRKTCEAYIADIKVDGTIDEAWDYAPIIPVDQVKENASAWYGDSSKKAGVDYATLNCRVLWDGDSTLFMLFEVQDKTISLVGANPWEQDSIEYFLQTENSTDPAAAKTQVRYLADGSSELPADSEAAFKETDGGFLYEISCDISAVGGAGEYFGIDFQYNDDAEGNGVRNVCLGWSDSQDKASSDPSVYGQCLLSDVTVDDLIAEAEAAAAAEAEAEASASSAQTSDLSIIGAMAALVAAAGAAFLRRRA